MPRVTSETRSPAWLVEPSGPLRGEVEVAGSKNAVTKHMVAAVMGSGPSVIENIPDIGDVDITEAILRSLGVGVERSEDRIEIHPADDIGSQVSYEYTGLNRIPILLLGPLLHLRHEVFVPLPAATGSAAGRSTSTSRPAGDGCRGGGDRRRDPCPAARCTAPIELPYPSVMATETVLLAAAMAEGRTVLSNAATEPEIVELALFLQRMGARLEQRPDRQFVIEGVERTARCPHPTAGRSSRGLLVSVAGLITGGNVRVAGCSQDRLVTAITTLSRMGAVIEINDDWITASPTGLRPVAVHTDTHPGFMTDWQSPLLVLMTQADGMSVLHETVFEDRVDTRRRWCGRWAARSSCSTRAWVARPVASTTPTPCTRRSSGGLQAARRRRGDPGRARRVLRRDRGGRAEGPSRIGGVNHLERGYNRPFETFRSLGLSLERDGADPTIRSLFSTVYVPSFLFSAGAGAVIPQVALTARSLGASVAVAGLAVALRGIGTMVFDVPSGTLVARLGERKAMLVGTGLLIASLIGAVTAGSVIVFSLWMFLMGCGWAVWMLARLTYVSEVMPLHLRGRALSTMGGVQRMGTFVGPFVGAAAVAVAGFDGVYFVQERRGRDLNPRGDLRSPTRLAGERLRPLGHLSKKQPPKTNAGGGQAYRRPHSPARTMAAQPPESPTVRPGSALGEGDSEPTTVATTGSSDWRTQRRIGCDRSVSTTWSMPYGMAFDSSPVANASSTNKRDGGDTRPALAVSRRDHEPRRSASPRPARPLRNRSAPSVRPARCSRPTVRPAARTRPRAASPPEYTGQQHHPSRREDQSPPSCEGCAPRARPPPPGR
jgi:UDP-N-acetylglucosamine 1-carboxyvinyltransferase